MSENYWREVDPPVSFIPEKWSYEQKRTFRYGCIPYLCPTVRFDQFSRKRVLCIGDGAGIDAVEFARGGAIVSVIDISEKSIALTRKHFAEANTLTWLETAGVADARELPFGRPRWTTEDDFDTVYSFGVIHHIVEVERVIAEVVRVLKPGGTFIGMVYHKDSLLYGYSILRRAEREGITADEAMRLYSERNPGCPHSVAYTKSELAELLKPFSSVSITAHYPVVDTEEKRKLSVGAPDELGWHLIFKAAK